MYIKFTKKKKTEHELSAARRRAPNHTRTPVTLHVSDALHVRRRHGTPRAPAGSRVRYKSRRGAFRFNRLRKKKKGAFFFSVSEWVSEWSGVSEDEQSPPGNRRSFDCGTGELRRRSVGPRPQLAWAHGLRSPSAILPAYPRPRRDAREAWAHGLQAHAQWEHVREHSGARGWVYNYLVFHHVIRQPARFFDSWDFSLSLLRMHETVPRMMHAASRVLIREVSLFQRLICTQEYTIGTSETVLIREVSLFQRLICTQYTVLIRERERSVQCPYFRQELSVLLYYCDLLIWHKILYLLFIQILTTQTKGPPLVSSQPVPAPCTMHTLIIL